MRPRQAVRWVFSARRASDHLVSASLECVTLIARCYVAVKEGLNLPEFSRCSEYRL